MATRRGRGARTQVDGEPGRRPAGTRTAIGFVPDVDREYTADEVRTLNAANPRRWPRYECAEGWLLVTPAPGPRHDTALETLLFALNDYLRVYRVAMVRLSPSDISWGREDTTLQPDVWVAPVEHVRAAHDTDDWAEIRHLLLVAEVISPRTATRDRGFKREVYQRRGVPLYWVIDHRTRTVEEWTPEAAHARPVDRLVWHPDGAAEPFVLELAALFAPPES